MALRYPLRSYKLTQGFGSNASYYKQFGQNGHNGLDLGANAGTPIYAADDGVVAYEGDGVNHGWMGSIAGIVVILKHSALHTGYAHMQSTVVNNGQKVKKGQLIGYVGSTGTATGPHLHFEVFPLTPNFSNGYAGRINPNPYLSTKKLATIADIKKAYLDILERPADADGLRHYADYAISFVRSDLAKSDEKRRLDAKKAIAAQKAADQAKAAAAKKAEEAREAAEAQKALDEARAADEAAEKAAAELARVAEAERAAREAAEARAKDQAELATKAKEEDMATVAAEQVKAEDAAAAVAESEVVKGIVSKVSDRTKRTVYFIGDALIGLGVLTPGIAVVVGWEDLVRVAALTGVFSSAGTFLLVMFGIYKSKK